MPTAAVVIIGDEILTGKFADENGPFLIRRFAELGTDLRRMAIIGDGVPEIADEVARAAAACDHVLTTGGVGPTHDDRTLEGVAAAFDLSLELRSEITSLLDRFGMEHNAANLRMATLPEGAILVDAPGSHFPVVRVRNVWVFPGVPSLMRAKFEDVAASFAGEQVCTIRLFCTQNESDIAHHLAAAQVAFPTVTIGSYPRWGEDHFRVMVSLDSRDREALDRAADTLRGSLELVEPPGVGADVEHDDPASQPPS